MPKLRTATQKALRWIWDYYWAKLSTDLSDTQDCKAYVKKLLGERNKQSRRKMEEQLILWDGSEVLEALMEIEGVTEDPEMLMRSLRLSEKIMNVDKSDQLEEVLTPMRVVKDLDGVKAELAKMQADLSDLEDAEPKLDSLVKPLDLEERGWSMWEGPWTPKPIGSIQ